MGVSFKLQLKISMRTPYQRSTGDFVLHCHILDHEDQGMMQNIPHRASERTGTWRIAIKEFAKTPAI